MATKPASQLRQLYDIREGVSTSIVTARGLSGNELPDFRKVIDTVEEYVMRSRSWLGSQTVASPFTLAAEHVHRAFDRHEDLSI
jgi:hypothetical protein